MKFLSIVLLSILTVLNVQAGEGKSIEFTEATLDNGLHVILHEDNSTPIVVVSIMYHVGAKNEDPERTGFAHFFEHLLFEGTKNIDRGEFDDLVTEAGGVNNANTSHDRTYYYEVLPSNQLELGLYLESERLMHANIDQIGVETQREVVKEERRERYENQPYGSFLLEILKNSYKVHPYKWAPIGEMAHLNEASLEEFMEFYNTFYVPENATLVITGDIDTKETMKLVHTYFDEIPRGGKTIPRPDEVEPPQTAEVRDTIFDNIQLPAVITAYHMPAQGTGDYYALDMLSILLSGGESSRLNKALIDEKEMAVAAGAFPLSLEDPGLYIAYAIAGQETAAGELEAAMDTEFEKVRTDLISEREFEKIRNQIENDLVSGNASLTGIATSLATYHVLFGEANLINTELIRYMRVTRDDIKRVAQKYLGHDNRVVLHYLPKPNN
ncbi:MAG: insulinase family protein [Bacteroidetes bacterium]|nr:insulinase family protein [Bacteroidota bacterium]